MLKHLPLIFKSTLRNKRRTVLTILSVALSLSLLGFLLAVYNMFYFEGSSKEQALRLVVRNKVSLANTIPLSYEQKIARVPGVKEIVVFQWFGGTYKDARDTKNFFGRFAIQPDRMFKVYPDYVVSDEQKKAFIGERSSCVVGRKLAGRFDWKLGDRVTIVGDIFPITVNLTIRGIYDSERDNENLLFHYDYLNESLKAGGLKDQVGVFILRMETPEDAPRIADAVDTMFRNAPQQTKTETERAFELSFLSFLGNVKAFLFAIFGAITFTVLLVSGNTMAMSVRERVKEVGVLKTLGFTQGKILALLLGESVVVAVSGGLLAVGATVLLCSTFRNMPSVFADMTRLVTPPWVLLSCLGIALVIGLVSSLVPALNASRRPILEALRVTD
jgi:putative ABC transport system permease protein